MASIVSALTTAAAAVSTSSSTRTSITNQNYKVPSTSKISVDKLLRVGFYDLERTIGKGNFAVVKLASNIVTKSKVAIKIIDKTCLNEEYLAKTYREISILKSLRHPHITRLYEVMQSETMIYLVTEYAANGEIFDHLVENGRMKEQEAARVFTQLVSAVQYCHFKGVVHRDLKAENVLLDKDMNIKLADFGFSNRYEDGNALSTWCGSPPYAAPEVFQGLNYDGPKADIWSLGVVLYALVCGALPFDGKTLLELKSRVVAGKFRIPYFMSQNCEHLIRNMLVVEPERRYTLRQIIKHRWLCEWAQKIEHEYLDTTSSQIISATMNTSSTNHPLECITSVSNLDTVVVSHMLQLSGLTADNIAQSVHENRFDNIYAIYHLLYDKLQKKRREYEKLQQHVNRVRSRTSITTGIVSRSEFQNTSVCIDRLSPLNNTSTSQNVVQWSDTAVNLEEFSDMELECLQLQNELQYPSNETASNSQTATVHSNANNNNNNTGNTRRHTVGPGDVAHEQALADPNVVPLNFKCAPQDRMQRVCQYPPINLPMLQNQPLHYLTIKDQHLLKPPLVMNATGSFNRRASDGGANLPYCCTTVQQNLNAIQGQHVQQQDSGYYISPTTVNTNKNDLDSMTSITKTLISQNCVNEENTEEIKRYMQTRGCTKRHTVGCTEDLTVNSRQTLSDHTPLTHLETTATSLTQTSSNAIVMTTTTGTGMRTRRTGLLTVTERPPVISPELIHEVETRMNRNYMPPALKMQFNAYSASLGQSTPSHDGASISSSYPTPLMDGNAHYIGTPTSLPLNVNALSLSNSPVTIATTVGASMSASVPSSALLSAGATGYSCRRIFGKACKLPPVQEVGRFSPVRRASDGSKAQFQGPLQECQHLQKGIAQRNHLAAPSPPLLENSISLPGSPINSKFVLSGNDTSIKRSGVAGIIPKPNTFRQCSTMTGNCLQLSNDVLQNLTPVLNELVKERKITIENAQNIITTGTMSWDIAAYLGIMSETQGLNTSSQYIPGTNTKFLSQQQPFSFSVTPSSPINIINSCKSTEGLKDCDKGVSPNISNFTTAHSVHKIMGGQICPISFFPSTISNSSCQSPPYGNCNSTPTQAANVLVSGGGSGNGSSPLHQITKGISYLTTGGRGSITRGTSGSTENTSLYNNQQPLDLSMDISAAESSNETLPEKPLNLSPCPILKVVTTPPASPNLCIIQEEHPPGQLYHGITSGVSNTTSNNYQIDEVGAMYQLTHPQICLTDVQGSETTLVAVSPENSCSNDSETGKLDPTLLYNTNNSTPLISLQRLIINEPTADMPSITRGIGRKTSLENELSQQQQQQQYNSPMINSNASYVNRRGSDKSLGFSDDSLSNDSLSNDLSPCQEPSASSGFKSDSHSEIGDHTEGHLTPYSLCESRRISNEVFYEVPLPYECSKLDTGRILELVKQTINSTMPPKGYVIHENVETKKEDDQNIPVSPEKYTPICNSTMEVSSNTNTVSSSISLSTPIATAPTYILDTSAQTLPSPLRNLSLEYSGGLQIEVQVCEGRSSDNQTTGKGIKLRRISGDEFEYGKLCQQLISNLSMQQVAG